MATITSGIYACYENQFTVGGNKVADMESFSVSIDNGVEEYTPFDSEGWIKRLMTSKSITISVSGKRNIGDTGNDLVAGLFMKNGTDAQKDVIWTFPNGAKVEFSNAIISVTQCGTGDSTGIGGLEFEIMSNGKPVYTEKSDNSGTGTSSTGTSST